MNTESVFTSFLPGAIFLLSVASASAAPLFEIDQPINIELTGPFSALIEDSETREELPFVLRAEGVDHSIRLRVRGKSRIRLCDFPPLRINFDIEQTEKTLFDGQDHLKLVTHCRGKNPYEENILEEFAAYRIFSLFTEVAFRVRLVRITYTDTDGQLSEKHQHRFGFLIESSEELSARVGGEPAQLSGIRLSELNADQAALVYVFEYLIGNTDWSLVPSAGEDICCHNARLINIAREIFYVPYDFDLSGIVNARYAKPDASLHMRSVRQRRYRGFCMDRDTLKTAIEKINSRKSAVLSVTRQIADVTGRDFNQAGKYLTQFFEKAEDVNKLMKSFENRCIDS